MWKHSSWIGYPDILNKLATAVYSLCFKRQTLELLLYLSFKVELPTEGLRDICLGFKIYPGLKKLLRGHQIILSYLELNFAQVQPQKGNFLLYPYRKVIGLTNYELKISNSQPKVDNFFP